MRLPGLLAASVLAANLFAAPSVDAGSVTSTLAVRVTMRASCSRIHEDEHRHQGKGRGHEIGRGRGHERHRGEDEDEDRIKLHCTDGTRYKVRSGDDRDWHAVLRALDEDRDDREHRRDRDRVRDDYSKHRILIVDF